MRSAIIALILLPAAHLLAVDSPWVEIRSPHFSVVTDAGDKKGREVALRLEQMQAVFGGFLLKSKLAQPIPLQVLALRSDKDYSQLVPYRQGQPLDAPAFLLRNDDRAFLVLNLFQIEPWRAAAHDLAHLWLEGNYPPTYPWFDEGLAEYFASIRVDNKQVEIGGDPELVSSWSQDPLTQAVTQKRYPPKPLSDFLLAPIWLDMVDLFTMRHQGEEATHRTLFYAQSWITLHYLINNKKMTETGAYFDLAQNQQVPVDQAIQRAYGMTSKQFEQAVKDYFKGQKMLFLARDQAQQSADLTMGQPYQFPTPIEPDTVAYVNRTVTIPEARALVAEVAARTPEHRAQAEADMAAVSQQFPDSAGVHRALAWIAIEKKDWKRAFDELEQALQLNPKEGWAHYYLALAKFRQAESEGQPMRGLANAMMDLRASVDWYPELAQAYNLLGLARIEGGGINSALDATKAAIKLNPRNEWYVFNLARVYESGKKFDEAKAILEHLRTAVNPQVTAAAKQQLKELEVVRKYGIAPEAPKKKIVLDEEPEETRQTPPEPPPDKRPVQYAKGKIVRVECSAPSALLTFAAGSRTLRLRAADTTKVIVIGADAFSCDWKGERASVNYKAGNKAGDADLVSVELEGGNP